jgi:hypothetical protein
MGLPGNDRQLVSVDISRGKRYVELFFYDATGRMRRVIKGQLDEDKLIERKTTALYGGRSIGQVKKFPDGDRCCKAY